MSMTSTNRIKILSSKPSLAFEDHQLRLLSDRSSLSQTDRPPHPQTKRPSIVSFNSQDFDFDDNCDPNSDSNSLGSDSTGNSHSSLFSLAVETQLENAKATLASLTGQLPQARHNIDQAKSQHALCERKVQRNEPQPANSMANFVTQWRSGTMIQRGDYKKKEEKDSEFARRRLLEAAEELLDANTQMDELNRQIAEAETEENNMEQLCNGLLVGNWEEIEEVYLQGKYLLERKYPIFYDDDSCCSKRFTFLKEASLIAFEEEQEVKNQLGEKNRLLAEMIWKMELSALTGSMDEV